MSSSPSRAASPLPLARETQRRLRTQRLGHPLEGHARLGSTNERALQRARGGAPEGTTVLADHQTQGRGRHGRAWQARGGQNLTFSVVLRPGEALAERAPLPRERWGLLALAGGLAACEAVAEVVAPLSPKLKWPNDVLMEGRKCCGVLLETSSGGKKGHGPVVLGVGLNVNQRAFPNVSEGRPQAGPTSLTLATGRSHVPRAPLLARLLGHLEARYQSLFTGDGPATMRAACEARMAGLGERVAVRRLAAHESGTALEGVLRGLAPSGALRLETDDGREHEVHAGDVTTRPGPAGP